jgi:hypothetical protein
MTVDVADMWTNQHLTHVRLWLVVKVPRGPVVGCHVAPRHWLVVLFKIVFAWWGVKPVTSWWANGLAERASHLGGRWFL